MKSGMHFLLQMISALRFMNTQVALISRKLSKISVIFANLVTNWISMVDAFQFLLKQSTAALLQSMKTTISALFVHSDST